MKREVFNPTTLVLIEGWGLSPFWINNPIEQAEPENFNYFWNNYPHLALKTLSDEFNNTEFSIASLSTGTYYKPYSKNYTGEKVYFHSKKSLSEIISDNNYRQLKITEKISAKNIGFYFNSFSDNVFKEEKRIEIGRRSPDFIKNPELSIDKIPETLEQELENSGYEFILVILPNLDLLKNQNDFKPISSAIKSIDDVLSKIVNIVLKNDGQLFITASCGGAEKIGQNKLSEISTKEISYVPFIHITPINKKQNVIGFIREITSLLIEPMPAIDCIAPTILESMFLKVSPSMSGKSLINEL